MLRGTDNCRGAIQLLTLPAPPAHHGLPVELCFTASAALPHLRSVHTHISVSGPQWPYCWGSFIAHFPFPAPSPSPLPAPLLKNSSLRAPNPWQSLFLSAAESVSSNGILPSNLICTKRSDQNCTECPTQKSFALFSPSPPCLGFLGKSESSRSTIENAFYLLSTV